VLPKTWFVYRLINLVNPRFSDSVVC